MSSGGPVVYLLAADIAEHFGVPVRTVTNSWQARYGPDRTPEQIAKAPVFPRPDAYFGRAWPRAVWLPERLAEIEAWRAALPGRGAGSGRPRKPA